MSGAQIAAEISAALLEVGQEVGAGEFEVTILRVATPPATPWDTPAGDPDEYGLRAMVSAYKQGQVDGTLIKAGDVKVFLDATGITPSTSDRVSIATGPFAGEYAILSVSPAAYSGVALYYNLHCRK